MHHLGWGRAIIAAIVVALLGAIAPLARAEPARPSLRPDGPPSIGPYKVLSGSLHDHTTDSDGDTASSIVAGWLKAHHGELGIDFDTFTEHSDAFPEALGAPANPDPWFRQAALTKTTTGNGFSLMRGFEWTNDQQNHLDVIGSQNWTTRFTTGEAAMTMAPFWAWLSAAPVADPTGRGLGFGGGDGIGQFNHPGDKGALNWDDYAFNPAAARHMYTFEVHGGQRRTAADLSHSDAGWYWFALAKGWTVSPVMNWDWHDWTADGVVKNASPGRSCGSGDALPCQRTLVLSTENSPAALLDALRGRRTSASELPDLWATLRGPGDTWQGGTVAASAGQTISLTVDAGSSTQPLESVDIVSDAGLDPRPFFDGDNAPCTTSGCDPNAYVHDQLTPSYVVQHQRYVTSAGNATRKQHVDSPPPSSILASVSLGGHRATKTIDVRVPNVPSRRPDGKHFFYAVVHAKAPATNDAKSYPAVTARAWTGPILSASTPRGAWIAGDTHVHDDHSADGSLPRQGIDQSMPGNNSVADQIGQGERTGLGFLPLTDHRTYDQQWDPLWTSDRLVLVPGEEANGSPHATVLGAVDEIVDGANPPGSAAYRHVQQSVWDAHAQNANWGVAHPDDGEVDDNGRPNANASVVGTDTVEVFNRASDPDAEIDYAENRWNAGFRFGVVGASDDHFKELWAVSGPGQPTTWVFAPQRTERGVIAGLRAGHTTVSTSPLGPMVTLSGDFDGDGIYEAMSGDEVTTSAPNAAALRIRVKRAVGMTVLLYASPGRTDAPVATWRPLQVDVTYSVPVAPDRAWYRVEVRGPGGPPGIVEVENAHIHPQDELQAVASPIFIDTAGHAAPRPEVPIPALTGATDNAVQALEVDGAFTGFGDVAEGAGATHVVAERDDAGKAQVLYRRVAGDALGNPVRLSRSSSSARFPAVAARGQDVWVVWQDEPGRQAPHRTDIAIRHSSDGGATWDDAKRVTSGGKAHHPAIEVTAAGHPLVAWADNTGGAFDVYAQELGVDAQARNLSAPGKAIDAGNPADSRSPRYPASLFPSIAVSSSGATAVAWADDRRDPDPLWTGSTGVGEGTDPDDWEIFVAGRRGGAWSAPVDASVDATHADRHPSVAFGPDGSLYAAWDSKELKSSGVNVGLRWSRSTDDGRTWTKALTLAPAGAAMGERPRLASGRGGVRAVWCDSRSTDWRWSIWTASLAAAGASAPTRLSGAGSATWPAIDGDVVSFTSDRGARRAQRDQTEGVYVLRP